MAIRLKNMAAKTGKPAPKAAYILTIAFPAAIFAIVGLIILALNYLG